MSNQEQAQKSQSDDDEIDLLELIHTLLDGKWQILFFSFMATILAFIYAYGQLPIYKADTLLQVEEKKSGVPGLADLAGMGMGGGDSSVATELELIKSRKILGQAVESLKLDIIAIPKKIPLLGNLHQRFLSPDKSDKLTSVWSTFDDVMAQYAWGNELIRVSRLEVPNELLNKPLTLVLKKNGFYEVFFEEKLLLKGKIGQFSSSADRTIKIYITEIIGRPQTQYTLIKKSKLSAIEDLRKDISVSEKGKKTGMISLSIQGEDKTLISKTIEHISNTYVAQNKSRSAEEADSALKFLEKQIKPVKDNADKAEAKLSAYRTLNQTADMSVETQNILELVAKIDTELQQLSLQKDELGLKYTSNHPSMKVILSQEKKLQQRKRKTLSKISQLPKKQQELLKLESNFKVTNEIYHQMLNNIQEYKIAKASSVGNAYIIDTAVTYDESVKPKKILIITLGALLGGMLGILVVFLRKVLHQMVEDPEKLESITGIPVYATVPLSKEVKLTKAFRSRKQQKTLLAVDNNTDPAIESLRSLRTSLHFALLEAKNNIVMITGPSPGIGKSFISSNFAAVLCTGESKVLLIDADMRKGYLHNLLDINVSPGLSGLISQKYTIEETIHTVKIGDNSLDVMMRGQTPPNPSELLMHSSFEELLTKLSNMYDLILIDTPPVHAVTDPTIIGGLAGVTFMVVRHNQHTMSEIEHAVSRLAQNGVVTKGFIFNGHIAKKNRYGYGSNSYYGDYKSD